MLRITRTWWICHRRPHPPQREQTQKAKAEAMQTHKPHRRTKKKRSYRINILFVFLLFVLYLLMAFGLWFHGPGHAGPVNKGLCATKGVCAALVAQPKTMPWLRRGKDDGLVRYVDGGGATKDDGLVGCVQPKTTAWLRTQRRRVDMY